MMGANDTMKDAMLLMTKTNAFGMGSVRRTMDNVCRKTVGDYYVTSIVRSTTDTVSCTLDSVALKPDPMRPCRARIGTWRERSEPRRAKFAP